MESVLDHMAQNPELWAFLLLVSCGLGLPPWSEELVILGSGYFVAQDGLSYGSAVFWCWAGILAGDTIIYSLGRFAGDRVYNWPVLRSHLRPARRRRFNSSFLKHGTKVVFFARFLPGVRMVAYLVAGNLRMPYWKFVTLDSIGAALTVPISVWLGWKFASNLDYLLEQMHQYQWPLLILGLLLIVFIVVRLGRARRERFLRILSMRKKRDQDGS
ncbi:MAG: DedA family protein [Planctomycetota bacterium]